MGAWTPSRATTVRRCETIIHEANRRSTAKNFALGATKRDRRRLGIHFPAPTKGPEIDSFTPSHGRGSDRANCIRGHKVKAPAYFAKVTVSPTLRACYRLEKGGNP